MASFLLRPTFLAGLGATSVIVAPMLLRPQQQLFRPYRMDASPTPLADTFRNFPARDSQTPVVQKGSFNPQALKQVSAGSIFGLLGGLAISVFSKPLALIIGLLVFGVQFIESRGIHIIPYERIQRNFKTTNVRSLIQDNVAFKLSFGATFALAAFAKF
ncbi:uncharacterized protein BDZ99DRAFT_462413 [Mytilinidion resinicola]|uniref:FUN14-domain-containing protein n=1 Tax=Mytilinidion resinicola TaxID=574789 RepID=A0A6A6YRF7_9PEZI|nr:uncharacterized protein BDZ99DRAFT_462413 [Mytilinidion resinicola]KAF2811138.1 hypothetical protein BDZ99DRAFT_462413 [Mytilinidion resinicola]